MMRKYINHVLTGGLMMLVLFVCGIPAFGAAAEQDTVFFDTFEQLQDSCIELNRRISPDELLEKMPDTIAVYAKQQDGTEDLIQIPVTWQSAPDYQTTEAAFYLFQAHWDAEQFQLDPSYNMEDYTPFIEVIIENDKNTAEQVGEVSIETDKNTAEQVGEVSIETDKNTTGQMRKDTAGSKKYSYGMYSSASDAAPDTSQTLEEGIAHIVERARQQVEISWTALKSMKGYISTSGELTGSYKAGTTYYGIPYGQLIDSGKYVPHDASFDTFLDAVEDTDSIFYQKRGSYDSKNSTYYGSDCSAFVSYAYGLPRMTTTMISQSTQFSKVKGNSVQNAQPGDCFNRAGRHVEMITEIIKNGEGVITAVEVCEQTPPKARKVVYTPEKLQQIIDSGYTLLRFKKRQSVGSPNPYNGYHDNSSVSHLAALAVRENQKDATCLKEGSYESVLYCQLCGEELSRATETIPLGSHVLESSAVTVEAGCVTGGEQIQVCKICGETVTTAVPATGHSYECEVVQATCKEKGYTRYRCKICGDSYTEEDTDYTELAEHSGEILSVTPPGCTEKGFTLYCCKVCQYTYKADYTDAKGHTYAYRNQLEETHEIYCTECGDSRTEKHCYTDGKCVCGAEAVNLKTCDILLSSKSFTYTGNSKKPTVTVTDGKKNKVLKAGQDYVISYTNNVEAGTAAVVVEGRGGYKGSVRCSFTINKAQNSITASNMTMKADPVKTQSATLKIQTRCSHVTFRSNNPKIKVDAKGTVTVPENFVGKGQITVTSGDSNYCTAAKEIDVTVTPIANEIIAEDITKITSVNTKSFSLEAGCSGSATMKYSSSNPLVKVDKKGIVIVNRQFVGEAIITIQTAAKGIYKAAAKKIKVTIIPAIPRQIKGTSPGSGQIKLEWRKITQAYGYQIAYSTDKSFKSNVKTMKIGNGKGKETKLAKTISGLTKNAKYYVCIRTMQVVKGKTYYSQWSEVQTVKVK